VKAFDVIKDVCSCIRQGQVALAMDALALDHAEESFGCCVVSAVALQTPLGATRVGNLNVCDRQ